MRKTAVQPTRGMDGKSGMRALLCLMMFFVNVGVGGAYSLPEALTGHVKPNEMEYALNLGKRQDYMYNEHGWQAEMYMG